MTVTLITLLTRREGMSREDFRDYYESNHRRIGEQVLAGYATRYIRRYITPLDGADRVGEPDVVMEIDFADHAAMDAFFLAVSRPDIAAMIAEDEAMLFDRGRIRSYVVEENASAL